MAAVVVVGLSSLGCESSSNQPGIALVSSADLALVEGVDMAPIFMRRLLFQGNTTGAEVKKRARGLCGGPLDPIYRYKTG